MVWLLRLLLFKLMFSSGLTKLTWGDPTWLDGSALRYHYWTQPIPTALAWYASHLPRGLQVFSCLLMFVVELALPFLIFAPRRPRRIALYGFLALQGLIAATGNYGFFNLLAAVLCVPLVDDRGWPAALRSRLLGGDGPEGAGSPPARRPGVTVVATLLALLSIPPLVDAFHGGYWRRHPGHPLLRLTAITSPLLLSNSYGLFRTMTRTRPEIEIEGSEDGRSWRAFGFRYKPGDPARRPRFFAPHMPRLDWQMWFAALRAEGLVGDPEATRAWLDQEDFWLQRLLVATLRGEPRVLELLGPAPFGGRPPRYVRLVLWQYRFSDHGSDWWVRKRRGCWWARWRCPLPPVRLRREQGIGSRPPRVGGKAMRAGSRLLVRRGGGGGIVDMRTKLLRRCAERGGFVHVPSRPRRRRPLPAAQGDRHRRRRRLGLPVRRHRGAKVCTSRTRPRSS